MSILGKDQKSTEEVSEDDGYKNVLPPEVLELLDKGRFAEYHLEKAKFALARKDYKLAAYQVGASLAHEKTDAALELKEEIRRQSGK